MKMGSVGSELGNLEMFWSQKSGSRPQVRTRLKSMVRPEGFEPPAY